VPPLATFRLPPRQAPLPARILVAIVLPGLATVSLPIATIPPMSVATGSIGILALSIVALAGMTVWLAARAIARARLDELAFLTTLATALSCPFGASLLPPAIFAIIHYHRPAVPRAANDNRPSPTLRVGWATVSPARARMLADQFAA
jgi:hypothetical protein